MNNGIAAGGLNNLNHIQRELTEIDTGADADHQIHLHEFSRQLNEWSQNGLNTEYRLEASQRILRCFTQRTTNLDLGRLGLRSLPDCLRHLTQLRTLDVNGNRLESFPDCLHCLRNLTVLRLCGNRLQTLPEDFWKNKIMLHELSVQNNRLTSFPVPQGRLFAPGLLGGPQVYGVNLAEQPRVHRIELGGNHLTSLPIDIQLLRGLRILDLNHNELNELPGSIWQLSNLHELDVSYNELNDIPEPMPARLTEHMFRNRGRLVIDPVTANTLNRSIFRLVPVVVVHPGQE